MSSCIYLRATRRITQPCAREKRDFATTFFVLSWFTSACEFEWRADVSRYNYIKGAVCSAWGSNISVIKFGDSSVTKAFVLTWMWRDATKLMSPRATQTCDRIFPPQNCSFSFPSFHVFHFLNTKQPVLRLLKLTVTSWLETTLFSFIRRFKIILTWEYRATNSILVCLQICRLCLLVLKLYIVKNT